MEKTTAEKLQYTIDLMRKYDRIPVVEQEDILVSAELYEEIKASAILVSEYPSSYLFGGWIVRVDPKLEGNQWRVSTEKADAIKRREAAQREAEKAFNEHPDRWWNHSQAKRDYNGMLFKQLFGK